MAITNTGRLTSNTKIEETKKEKGKRKKENQTPPSHDSRTQAALSICTATDSHWRKKIVARLSPVTAVMRLLSSFKKEEVSRPKSP